MSTPVLPFYGQPFVRQAISQAAAEYVRRLEANDTKRRSAASVDALSRHLNPDNLESLRSMSRSADSVLGNILELLARTLARGKWGPACAPPLIAGLGVAEAELDGMKVAADKQIIYSRVDAAKAEAAVRRLYAGNRVNWSAFSALRANPPMGNSIVGQPIDLVAYDGVWTIAEMKSSGDLDAKNGPANVVKLLTAAVLAGPEAQPRFVLTQRAVHQSSAGNFVPSELLVGRETFWEWLLPVGMSYADFDALFAEAAAAAKGELSRYTQA